MLTGLLNKCWTISCSSAGLAVRALAVGGGIGQASQGRLVDALASRGDEGRGTLRKATGSRERAVIRGYPNGETRPFRVIVT